MNFRAQCCVLFLFLVRVHASQSFPNMPACHHCSLSGVTPPTSSIGRRASLDAGQQRLDPGCLGFNARLRDWQVNRRQDDGMKNGPCLAARIFIIAWDGGDSSIIINRCTGANSPWVCPPLASSRLEYLAAD